MIRLPLFLLCLLAIAFPAVAEVPDHPAEQLAARTWVIHGPLGLPSPQNRGFMNNPAFVLTDAGVVVIDPGSSVQAGRMVLRQIRKITDRPVTHVLNSHVHGDHWLGNQAFAEAFPGVKILAHPEMIARARAGAAEQWVRTMESMTDGATAGTRAVLPDAAVDDAQVLRIDGLTFRILAPPKAHSHTDIMILVEEEGVLFLGDNVLHRRIGRMDDGTFRGNVAAIDIALASPAKIFVPGHGRSGGREVVEPYRRYLAELYAGVKALYEEGLTDFEMKPKLLPRFAFWRDWSGFEDEFGKHISLALLEVEQAEFE